MTTNPIAGLVVTHYGVGCHNVISMGGRGNDNIEIFLKIMQKSEVKFIQNVSITHRHWKYKYNTQALGISTLGTLK